MMGILIYLAWTAIGVIVASIEKSRRDPRDIDPSMVTLMCVAGAIVGATLGQSLHWFVFGQPIGFVFAVAGAELFLQAHRARGRAVPIEAQSATQLRAESAPVPTTTASTSVLVSLLGGLAWSMVSAVAVATGGFLGHLAGDRMFPQRYEGFPSDILFIPLGLVLGVLIAGTAKAARPRWGAVNMLAVITLASAGYASLLYEYSRSHALPAGFTVMVDPNPGVAVRCDAVTICPPANPPLEWTVEGSVTVKEKNGLGATVDAISLSSYEKPVYGAQRPSREEITADNRFGGPNVRLEGRDIPGPRRLKRNDVVTYPIRYFYRTRSGSADREISIHFDFTDSAGHWSGAEGLWKVR